jgi:steroid 5-alpha reductase family enzyme
VSSHADVLASTALVILILMIVAWLISLALGNASIVAVFWGLGFVVVGWVSWAVGDGHTDRSNLLVAMVSIWGVRLTGHLWRPVLARGEHRRHRSARRSAGERFAARSLFTIFLAAGAAMWIVSLPIQLAVTPAGPPVRAVAVIGVVIWGLGLFFAMVGDAQLARFRAEPANQSKVLDWGLRRYTRHPRQFGDFCVWWGIWLVAADAADARIGAVGPVLLSIHLLRSSAAAGPEDTLGAPRDGYDLYAARTSSFFPRSPRAS